MSDFEDEYTTETGDAEVDVTRAVLDARIAVLASAEPICLPATATVREAIQRMLARRQAGVLIVDGDGRLAGIFTERDVLTRVVGPGRDPARTPLADVMTPNPEALTAAHRVAYAIHCMSVAGYRTVPLVDDAGRPIGIVTVGDVVRWLADLFPEAILNLAPGGDTLKHPGEIDAG
ncbi:MAG: CBS domain-containing protein [Candidatus Rokubacteria bacterium]|nr:CBS domain-containing protein [Candidatus Rokubacteria bacterium]MBI3826587.1 CBS domain-containing protein [Candidatus Rokubacteria bacterium]